jgi:glycine cleavage system H protein
MLKLAPSTHKMSAASDIYAPVSGSVEEVNAALQDTTSLINSAPYEGGWIAKIRLSDPTELDGLMRAEAYDALTLE